MGDGDNAIESQEGENPSKLLVKVRFELTLYISKMTLKVKDGLGSGMKGPKQRLRVKERGRMWHWGPQNYPQICSFTGRT